MCVSVVVLTLPHRHNAVRGHRTSPNDFGQKDYPRGKKENCKTVDTVTEAHSTPQKRRKCTSVGCRRPHLRVSVGGGIRRQLVGLVGAVVARSTRGSYIPFCFSPMPFLIFALLSRSLLVVTQIRGHAHSRLFPSPSSLRYTPCIVIAIRLQPFLPSSTRIELRLYPR